MTTSPHVLLVSHRGHLLVTYLCIQPILTPGLRDFVSVTDFDAGLVYDEPNVSLRQYLRAFRQGKDEHLIRNHQLRSDLHRQRKKELTSRQEICAA